MVRTKSIGRKPVKKKEETQGRRKSSRLKKGEEDTMVRIEELQAPDQSPKSSKPSTGKPPLKKQKTDLSGKNKIKLPSVSDSSNSSQKSLGIDINKEPEEEQPQTLLLGGRFPIPNSPQNSSSTSDNPFQASVKPKSKIGNVLDEAEEAINTILGGNVVPSPKSTPKPSTTPSKSTTSKTPIKTSVLDSESNLESMLVGQSQTMENVIESSKESEEQGLKGLINYTDSESTPESDKQRKEEEEKRKQEEEEARIAEEKKEEEARIEKEKKEAKEKREQERKREEEREFNRKREEEKRKEEERKRAEEKKIIDQKLAEQQMLEEENRKEEQRKRLEEKKRELERKKEEHRKREEQKRREEERQKEEEERREREIAERRTKRRQEKRPVLAEEEEEESEEESSEDDDSNDENEEPDDSDATASEEEMEEPMLLKRKIPVKSSSRKKKVKSSHSKELRTPFATFSCREAFDHYAQIASKRALPDKGFSPESLQEFPLLQATITKLGWERFCEVPSGYNLSLVREFYAEAAVTEGTTVRLRGTDVSYSPAVIDTIFGVHAPVPSLYTRLLNEATDDDAQRILAALVQPGKTWKNAVIRNIESRDLAPHISIWFYFLRHTLQPTTHDSSINFDRLIILYCIMYGKRISVGEVIAKSIGHCAEKISGKCWHPSLIHTLITKANVKTFPTDEVTCGKAVIKGDTVRRVTRNAEEAIRKSQAAVKPQGSKQSAKAATIISKAAALATQKQSTPSRVPRSDVPPPAQEDLNTNSFLYLTKQLERNQETLLKKLQERDTMWLSVMAKHKKEMEEKLEKSEQKVLACLKEQDKAVLQMRKLTALHRNYQMKREGVMEMEWALNHPDDYESIGRYPPELLKEAAEFLQQAEKPPTPPE